MSTELTGMDEPERSELSMLMLLHATCESAVEMFSDERVATSGQLVADLKRVLEQTSHELERFRPA